MADVVVTKTPAAAFDYDMEFSDLLPSGAAVVTKTVSAIDSAGTANTAVIPSSSVSGTKVRIHVAAGTDLEDYTITALATTTSDVYGRILELRVRADAIDGSNKS